MKLWDKGYSAAQWVEKFTVGNDRILDLKLAKYDVQASKAHAQMLQKIDVLSQEELDKLITTLDEIQQSIEAGSFVIEEGFEDMHSKIEYLLTENTGDAGKKIHTARSRNDQVLVALHLYVKEEIKQIKTVMYRLFDTLLQLAEKHKTVLLPGYTHLQMAMPSSFGMWFSSYAESMIDDLILLETVAQVADQNPLGSAAGYGTSFPVDRSYTTELMGFKILKYNAVAAQMSRGKLEKTLAFALASVSGTLSKMASDIILYMSPNFGFLSFPREFTTGSSIMPHKQNPDVFELLRGRSNKIQSLPAEIILMTNNLTSGYHRDFQLLKESLMRSVEEVKENLTVLCDILPEAQPTPDILEQKMYDPLFSVETANQLVLNGMPFRDAYKKVGKELTDGSFSPQKNIQYTHEGSIGNLCLEEIREKWKMYEKC
ncbi:MAG: argininosuccinate lyase [Bacteroidales bacterium]|nr:argininosuccinate lyase [Bacteroidales bacterium]